jgi:hypothetical protein
LEVLHMYVGTFYSTMENTANVSLIAMGKNRYFLNMILSDWFLTGDTYVCIFFY